MQVGLCQKSFHFFSSLPTKCTQETSEKYVGPAILPTPSTKYSLFVTSCLKITQGGNRVRVCERVAVGMHFDGHVYGTRQKILFQAVHICYVQSYRVYQETKILNQNIRPKRSEVYQREYLSLGKPFSTFKTQLRESERWNQKALSSVCYTTGGETYKSYVDQAQLFILANPLS